MFIIFFELQTFFLLTLLAKSHRLSRRLPRYLHHHGIGCSLGKEKATQPKIISPNPMQVSVASTSKKDWANTYQKLKHDVPCQQKTRFTLFSFSCLHLFRFFYHFINNISVQF
ncbi:uncharacterized protein BYT42DRAFT_413897 [Radiomyces spectabilis]|uniref:uncharacterized protein n=1 Tax=Radiomyces spectabilis TaxID=64574 RepID=UPI00221ED1D1|nr:uncharacterized protein BYT42DRAFT_413897 [Radiomyces spectabilis]KAI8374628.1 hypothetical protein BYT42DRAFT_413897 [Radiomyces spectabilis]